jgi:HPt (histidine-containing phosphotransfer) domain-containing protein
MSVFDIPEIPISTKVTYLERRGEELRQMEEALADSNFKLIRELAHRMKGNGTTFGFPEITALGGDLEACAESGSSSAIRSQLERLSTVLVRQRLALGA